MDYGISGKTIIVTGGSKGLGQSVSIILASEGANIVVCYNGDDHGASETVARIKRVANVKAASFKADVSKEKDVKALFDFAQIEIGDLYGLVNNAGVCTTTMITDMPIDEWNFIMDINSTGVFLTCKEFANRLIPDKKIGKIVNVASLAAYIGSTSGKTHYCTSKGAVIAFTKSFAQEVSPKGIYVNAIAPGVMYTEMTKEILDEKRKQYENAIPLGRIATTDEVAKVIAFLLSDSSSFITGSTIDVTGGQG